MRTMPTPPSPVCEGHRQVLDDARERANHVAARVPDDATCAYWFVSEVHCRAQWYWYAVAPIGPDLTGLGRIVAAEDGWARSKPAAHRQAARAASELCGGDAWARRLSNAVTACVLLAMMLAVVAFGLLLVDFRALPRIGPPAFGLAVLTALCTVAHAARVRHLKRVRSTRH